MNEINVNDIEYIVNEVVKQIRQQINESVLTEALSSVIYHFTTINKLINISKTGKFLLGNGNKTDSNINGDYPYYMSFTRERSSKIGYAAYINGDFNQELGKDEKKVAPSNAYWVRLEINGDKLNNNYKGKAVNYHFSSNKNNPISKLDEPSKVKYRQSEDRLFSHNKEISLFSRDKKNKPVKDLNIITRIDILFPREYRKPTNETFQKIKWLMKNPKSLLKDKIFLYSDKSSFDNMAAIDNTDTSQLRNVRSLKKKLTVTPSAAQRLVPLICILYLAYKTITQNKVYIKSIIEKILSSYKSTVTLKEYNKTKIYIYEAYKNLDVNNIVTIVKSFNPSFLQNTFRNELIPIYQEAIELYRNIMKTLGCKKHSDLVKKLFL